MIGSDYSPEIIGAVPLRYVLVSIRWSFTGQPLEIKPRAVFLFWQDAEAYCGHRNRCERDSVTWEIFKVPAAVNVTIPAGYIPQSTPRIRKDPSRARIDDVISIDTYAEAMESMYEEKLNRKR